MTITVDAAALRRAIERVVPAVSRARKEPALTRVLVHRVEGALRLVATDRARLVVGEVPLMPGADTGPDRAMVSPSDLAGFMPDGSATVDMSIDPTSVCLESGGGVLDLAASDGEFPDYERLLAATPDAVEVIVDRAALLEAIEDQADGGPLRFCLVAGALELGEPPVSLPANHDGQEVTFLLDPTFAHDAVEAASGPTIAIEARSEVSPVAIRTPDDETFIAILMPMRVREPLARRGLSRAATAGQPGARREPSSTSWSRAIQ